MKNIYFLSDAHLGSLAIDHRRMQERRLVRFLDSIKEKAAAIYLLGDMFDFWYEYRYVVPKGFTRFLGKLSELTDMGVEVHYFTGNHDIWAYDYLEKECGVILHKKPETTEIYGKIFFLAHGDGLGDIPQQALPVPLLVAPSPLGYVVRPALGQAFALEAGRRRGASLYGRRP